MKLKTIASTNQGNRQLIVAGMVGAVAGVAIGVAGGADVASTVVVLAGLGLVIIGWLIWMIRREGWDWLAPPTLFVIATAFYYMVRPGSLLLGMQPIGQTTTRHMNAALGLVFLSVVGFSWGYKLRGTTIIARWLPRVPSGWQRRRATVTIGALWIAGTVCWVLLMWQSGGVGARWAGYAHGLAAGKGVLVVLSAAMLTMALVLSWAQYLKGRFSRPAAIVLVVTTIPLLAMHGQRSALIIPILMAVAIYHYQCRRLGLRSLAIISIAVMIIFVGLGLPRLQFLPGPAGQPRLMTYGRVAGWFFMRNLTSFDALMMAKGRIPEDLDYQWGRGYVDALVMMIPRWLYPDKPERNLFNRALRPGRTTSMALPVPGEGYLNFGWGGVLLESVLLGLICRVVYAYRQQYPNNEGALLTYAFFFAFFVVIFRGGLMGGHIGLLAVCLVLIAAVSIFCSQGRLLIRIRA